MSSTNRKSDRHASDYYITPKEEVYKFLVSFERDYGTLAGKRVLDPCAGGHKDVGTSYPDVLKEFGVSDIDTLDIREDSGADIIGDYLSWETGKQYDLIISNPPFILARDFIDKSRNIVGKDGIVVFLLRINFLGSMKRFDWWRDNLPHRIYVHHKRMSFTADGKTDSIEYGHFVWTPEITRESRLKII